MNGEQPAAGEPIPSDAVLIEVRVAELRQLFNAIDPSPFREKDIERGTDEIFLYDWWPILANARLYDRLSEMPVRVALTTSPGRN